MDFLIVLVLLLIVVLVVSAPLRRSRPADGETEARERLRAEREVAELEAARDAKYREIRDAELDHETGKLDDADFARLDRDLRAEAIELLKRLDRAQRALRSIDNAGAALRSEPTGDARGSDREREQSP